MKSLTDLQKLFDEFDSDRKVEFIKNYPEIWNDCYDIMEQSRYHRVMSNCVKAGWDACQSEMLKREEIYKELVEKMKAAIKSTENILANEFGRSNYEVNFKELSKAILEVAEIEKSLK